MNIMTFVSYLDAKSLAETYSQTDEIDIMHQNKEIKLFFFAYKNAIER